MRLINPDTLSDTGHLTVGVESFHAWGASGNVKVTQGRRHRIVPMSPLVSVFEQARLLDWLPRQALEDRFGMLDVEQA